LALSTVYHSFTFVVRDSDVRTNEFLCFPNVIYGDGVPKLVCIMSLFKKLTEKMIARNSACVDQRVYLFGDSTFESGNALRENEWRQKVNSWDLRGVKFITNFASDLNTDFVNLGIASGVDSWRSLEHEVCVFLLPWRDKFLVADDDA
jgi:hypothetical protein